MSSLDGYEAADSLHDALELRMAASNSVFPESCSLEDLDYRSEFYTGHTRVAVKL
jgi:hypothetical protein